MNIIHLWKKIWETHIYLVIFCGISHILMIYINVMNNAILEGSHGRPQGRFCSGDLGGTVMT